MSTNIRYKNINYTIIFIQDKDIYLTFKSTSFLAN